ncbi:RNA-directed DNA polymerase (Reverse transcriptase), partial [Trifolium medium]|nr:RNA-directed DNA polymerase (Reverse transcriptase) [Trifolium medium]
MCLVEVSQSWWRKESFTSAKVPEIQSNLVALKDLFTRYALASGQVVNARKSTIYAGGITHARLTQIAHYIGFSIDKVKAKLAAWKASLLSIA